MNHLENLNEKRATERKKEPQEITSTEEVLWSAVESVEPLPSPEDVSLNFDDGIEISNPAPEIKDSNKSQTEDKKDVLIELSDREVKKLIADSFGRKALPNKHVGREDLIQLFRRLQSENSEE